MGVVNEPKREERSLRGRSGTAIPEGKFKLDLEEFLVIEVEESLSRLAMNLVCEGGVVVVAGPGWSLGVDIVYGMVWSALI